MSRGPDPGGRLRDVRVPGEEAAEQRSWEIVRTAYEERTPVRPAHRARRLALALGGGLAALAIVLSPAGAKVGELVSDVVGIGEEDAKPALRSLPAAGELLVESEQGPWIVREDGSKRLLGDYEEASWSQPRGLYVAATDGRTLLAVEPDGTVRWTITAPAPVHDPRWAPSGVRVAYRSAGDLWVVNGDGSDPRRIARDVAPTAPQWLPPSAKAKLAPAEAVDLVAYIDRRGKVQVVSGDNAHTDSQFEDAPAVPARAENRLGDRSRRRRPDRTTAGSLESRGRRRWDALGSAREARPAHRPDLVARRPLAARRLASGRSMAVHPDQALGQGDPDRLDLRAVRPGRHRRRLLPPRQRLDPAATLTGYGSGGSRSWCAEVKKLR